MDYPSQSLTLYLPLHHPSYPGHFPDRTIVPGVLLLAKVIESLQALHGHTLQLNGLRVIKFLAPLMPGDIVQLRFTSKAKDTIRFQCLRQKQQVATGELEVVVV